MDGRFVWVAIWAVFALIWLTVLPREAKGKGWHRALAAAPLLLLLAAAVAPASLLSDALNLWALFGLPILAVLSLAWAAGTATPNHGLMDVAYPLAPLAAAATGVFVTGRTDPPALLMLVMTTVWGLRLSIQTWGHNKGSEREPYATWRRRFGGRWIWFSAFQIHALQGVSIWIWCASFAFILTAPAGTTANLIAIAGVVVWLAGFLLQSTADAQLARFKADPSNRGGLLDTGAWALVRHPNYLGETVMWAGWFVMALAHPWGWIAVVSPLYVGWFMGFASAAPFKEHHMRRTRPEAWAAYCARTPMFFPLPRPKAAR